MFCTICNILRLFVVGLVVALSFYRDAEGGLFNKVMRNSTSVIYRAWSLAKALAIFRACRVALPQSLMK